MTETPPFDPALLPSGVRSRFISGINGLRMHILEAGFEEHDRPGIMLLHGFPELAWSWRKIIRPLADAGFHVVAPDQRGYGRTTGWDPLARLQGQPLRWFDLIRDTLGLMFALGHRSVSLVGHDFGSPVAAWCALLRPDIVSSVTLMSGPFSGPPALPFGSAGDQAAPNPEDQHQEIHAELAQLPRPRKHYQWYYSKDPANVDMLNCSQGVHDFLRAYYHVKSADWPGNRPFRLLSWTAAELAKMPNYYIMDLDQDMASTVAEEMPGPDQIARCKWLPDYQLKVYSDEFSRTGFQGGLEWYRCRTSGRDISHLQVFSGRTIDVPSMFIAGASDWGVYQVPGAFERMQESACTRMTGCHLIEGAGHWVQQEQPDQVLQLLVPFLHSARG